MNFGPTHRDNIQENIPLVDSQDQMLNNTQLHSMVLLKQCELFLILTWNNQIFQLSVSDGDNINNYHCYYNYNPSANLL